MSRSYSRLLTTLVTGLTAPLSRRQQRRTIARLINRLTEDSLSEIETARGTIKLYGLKSGYVASAVERFHSDEPETLKFIDQINDGEILWDIGANIGIYSLYAALHPTVTVYAFEPSGFNFGLLVEHIALNNLGGRIKPLCIGLSDHTAIDTLNMTNTESGHAGNALGDASNQFEHFDAFFTQAVLAYRIDDFVTRFGLEIPQHIKLDVDGIEPLIIAGAIDTLPKVKRMLIEVEGRNAEQVNTLIESPLQAAGFHEDLSVRASGSGRNRLYVRQ